MLPKITLFKNRSARLFISVLAAKGQADLDTIQSCIREYYKVEYSRKTLYDTGVKLFKHDLILKYRRIQEYGVKWDVMQELEKAFPTNPKSHPKKIHALTRGNHVAILKIVYENPLCTVGSVASKLNQGIDQISRDLYLLSKSGYVTKTRMSKNKSFKLLKINPELVPFWEEFEKLLK